MRHRRSLSPEYFEGMFAKAADPWGFETSPYETAKYDHTLAALSDRRYRQGFEIGCANGVLTRRLAAICDHLLAIDVSLTALSRARAHCAAHPNVRLERMVFPHDTPSDPGFDLIVLSEVAYYWDHQDLARAARWLGTRLAKDGALILVHWTAETDYPQSGDEAVEGLQCKLAESISVIAAERRSEYRLDMWRRR
jgi:predicted TPR repeat methyltransferase